MERLRRAEEEVRRENEEYERRGKQTWIRKEADVDGYFLLQLVLRIDNDDMFLTAEDALSLTIAGK